MNGTTKSSDESVRINGRETCNFYCLTSGFSHQVSHIVGEGICNTEIQNPLDFSNYVKSRIRNGRLHPTLLSLTADFISVQQDIQFESDGGIQHVRRFVRRRRFSSSDRSLPTARPSRTSFSCAGWVVSWFVDDAQYSWHQSVSCTVQHRRNRGGANSELGPMGFNTIGLEFCFSGWRAPLPYHVFVYRFDQ